MNYLQMKAIENLTEVEKEINYIIEHCFCTYPLANRNMSERPFWEEMEKHYHLKYNSISTYFNFLLAKKRNLQLKINREKINKWGRWEK